MTFTNKKSEVKKILSEMKPDGYILKGKDNLGSFENEYDAHLAYQSELNKII